MELVAGERGRVNADLVAGGMNEECGINGWGEGEKECRFSGWGQKFV